MFGICSFRARAGAAPLKLVTGTPVSLAASGIPRTHGVEPYAYLKDVLERFPTMTNQQVAQLTPLNWKKEHPSPVKLAA